MQPPVIHTLLDLGEQMQEALLENDLDALLEKLSLRAEMIESLPEVLQLSPADREQIATSLIRQQRFLEETLARQERRLSEALERMATHQTARRTYRQGPPPRRLLNKNLRG